MSEDYSMTDVDDIFYIQEQACSQTYF